MDWSTFLSVVIGGLIATIPVLISNRFQAIEREKERQEQRKDAKTLLAIELMRNKIKILENDIDDSLWKMAVAAHTSLSNYEGKYLMLK